MGWESLIGPIVGGLLGSQGNETKRTQQYTGDPRFDEYMYGAGGVLPAAARWYGQNQTGLNDQMLTGMNNQWAQLGASKPGFDQMQQTGMGLLGGPVAGNPFTQGYGGPTGGGSGGGGTTPPAPSQQSSSWTPAQFGTGSPQFTQPAMNPYTAPGASQTQAAASTTPDWLTQFMQGGYGAGGDQASPGPDLTPEGYASNVQSVNNALTQITDQFAVNAIPREIMGLLGMDDYLGQRQPTGPNGMTVNEMANRTSANRTAGETPEEKAAREGMALQASIEAMFGGYGGYGGSDGGFGGGFGFGGADGYGGADFGGAAGGWGT